MKYKDYMKLMKTPYDELSEQDQKKRKKEFHRRLKVCQMFLGGMVKGYINDDISKLMDSVVYFPKTMLVLYHPVPYH